MASETPPDGVGSAFQSSDLDEPMTKFGFSNDVRAKLLEENFDTASFAMIALTLMELDTIIKAYEADLQREFTRKEVAAFRQLWQFCQQKAQPAPPQPLAASASTAPPSFFWSEPVAFRRVYGLESYSRTSGESNHHRQSVSDVKNAAYQLSHEDDYQLCLLP